MNERQKDAADLLLLRRLDENEVTVGAILRCRKRDVIGVRRIRNHARRRRDGSGQQRTAVVGYRPYGDQLAIIASDNGAAEAPRWFANLKKDPIATVEVGSEKFKVRTRVATPDERPKIASLIEYLGPQQERTSREIPIVILERI